MNVPALIAALALALQAASPPTPPLAPTGKWEVAFDNDLCAMGHGFGEGRAAVTLAFRPFPLYDRMEAVLLLPNRFGQRIQGAGKVTLLPSGETFAATFDAFPVSNNSRAVHVEFERAAFDKLGTAAALNIDADKRTFAFALPSVERARHVLDQCETSLLKEWNVDPALRDKQRASVSGNPGRFFGPDSYPEAANVSGVQGKVVALLNVNAQGRVDSCRVVKTSQAAILDAKTCSIARQLVRYTPAVGSDGKPTASFVLLPVSWVSGN